MDFLQTEAAIKAIGMVELYTKLEHEARNDHDWEQASYYKSNKNEAKDDVFAMICSNNC